MLNLHWFDLCICCTIRSTTLIISTSSTVHFISKWSVNLKLDNVGGDTDNEVSIRDKKKFSIHF